MHAAGHRLHLPDADKTEAQDKENKDAAETGNSNAQALKSQEHRQ
ncbi:MULTISPECIES: hypothetical protein [Pannonibacter]|nr:MULTISPECIES: hypothetical protein [Pannonibacter]